jgi:hypothetical protein
MERLFVIVGRINSILFLLILVGAAISLSWVTFTATQSQRRGAVEVVETDSGGKAPVQLSFERIENIAGADTLMMRLSAQEKSEKFSSGGYGNETRNILFMSGIDKTARWLFKDHRNLILVSTELYGESPTAKDAPAKALYFEYVKTDTNKDEVLSSEDQSSIGLARPDGTGFTEILKNVKRIFSYEVIDQQRLAIVYQKEAEVWLAKFSLDDATQLSDQKLIEVPNSL